MWVKLLLILLSILSLPTITLLFIGFTERNKKIGCGGCKHFFNRNAFNWGMCEKLNNTTLPDNFFANILMRIRDGIVITTKKRNVSIIERAIRKSYFIFI